MTLQKQLVLLLIGLKLALGISSFRNTVAAQTTNYSAAMAAGELPYSGAKSHTWLSPNMH